MEAEVEDKIEAYIDGEDRRASSCHQRKISDVQSIIPQEETVYIGHLIFYCNTFL